VPAGIELPACRSGVMMVMMMVMMVVVMMVMRAAIVPPPLHGPNIGLRVTAPLNGSGRGRVRRFEQFGGIRNGFQQVGI